MSTKYKYKTVMLVDDNDIDNFVNRKTLEHIHFAEHIIAFISPANALEFIASTKTDNIETMAHLPQLIFLDLNMPIVMLPSSLNHSDRDQSLATKSVSHFISKPLERKHLAEL